jgi:hypothetical protein
MLYSLENSIRAIAPYLPEELVPPGAVERIASVAHYFPDGLSSQFGFECRLGPTTPVVDFVLLVAREKGGREILAGTHPHINLPQDLRMHPVWRRVRDFSVGWTDPGSPIYRNVYGVWIELDLEGPGTSVPVPGIFFHVGDLPLPAAVPPAPSLNLDEDYSWVIETAIPLLRGARLSATVEERLAACLKLSPACGQVLQVGLFPGRQIEGIRLFLHVRSQEHLLTYLEAVGWVGPSEELTATVGRLFQLGDFVYLNLDVGERVYPKIGIECHFRGVAQPPMEPRWPSLLAHLVEHGLCTPEKKEALLGFPGASFQRLIYERVFYRGLHHIKVVYQPGRPTEAKAYIGCKHQPLNEVDEMLRKAGMSGSTGLQPTR